MNPSVKAAVFDLDGVVTLTARVHFRAWKRLFDEVARKHSPRSGIARPFDEESYRRWVDGRPRIEGLRTYLDAAGFSLPEGAPEDPPERETIMGLSARKNAYFLELLEREGAEVDQAAVALIRELRGRHVRIGLATSSKNAITILRRAGLEDLFDARIDGIESARLSLRGKPHPDIFLECAKRLGGVSPISAALFEDASSGVKAAKIGGFGLVIGVDRNGSWMPLREQGADWIIRDFRRVTFDRMTVWMLNREHARPNLLARWHEIEPELRGKSISVFLDCDVTLTVPGARLISGRSRARAVEWLRDQASVKDRIPIYIGDDHADEQVFAAAGRRGLGVIVTELPRPTEARWSLQNEEDVRELLDRIAPFLDERAAAPRASRLH